MHNSLLLFACATKLIEYYVNVVVVVCADVAGSSRTEGVGGQLFLGACASRQDMNAAWISHHGIGRTQGRGHCTISGVKVPVHALYNQIQFLGGNMEVRSYIEPVPLTYPLDPLDHYIHEHTFVLK